MSRVVSTIMLLVGAALLVTWLVSPASSAPQTREPAVAASPAETTAALDDLNTQLDQLRQRLAAPGALAPPTRDPFSFATRATPPSRRDAPSPAEEEPVTPADSVAWPTLVAILDFATGTPPVRRAALSIGTDVRIVSAGDTVGAWQIHDISPGAVTVVDRTSGHSRRLSLE